MYVFAFFQVAQCHFSAMSGTKLREVICSTTTERDTRQSERKCTHSWEYQGKWAWIFWLFIRKPSFMSANSEWFFQCFYFLNLFVAIPTNIKYKYYKYKKAPFLENWKSLCPMDFSIVSIHFCSCIPSYRWGLALPSSRSFFGLHSFISDMHANIRNID